jgi:hypothetical protein
MTQDDMIHSMISCMMTHSESVIEGGAYLDELSRQDDRRRIQRLRSGPKIDGE